MGVNDPEKGGGLMWWLRWVPVTSEFTGSRLLWYSGVKEIKHISFSLVKIQYCGDTPWPRGVMLRLKLPEIELRILRSEDNVTWFISHPQNVLLAQFSLYGQQMT